MRLEGSVIYRNRAKIQPTKNGVEPQFFFAKLRFDPIFQKSRFNPVFQKMRFDPIFRLENCGSTPFFAIVGDESTDLLGDA